MTADGVWALLGFGLCFALCVATGRCLVEKMYVFALVCFGCAVLNFISFAYHVAQLH